jgi:hypothetical protein
MAEQMLLDRRCPDAGWNYGNRRVLGEDLPGYPETTAVSLMGLQGVTYDKLKLSLNQALRWWEDPASRLARAWLTICLKSYGLLDPEAKPSDMPPSPDITVSALEALGAAGGSWSLLRAGEWLS